MLGMISNYETYLNFTFEALGSVLRRLCEESGECHEHGCGFAWYQQGWQIRKDKSPLWESSELRQLINWTRSRAMIIHARKATYPVYAPQGRRPENAHPFLEELIGFRWVFAHNGFIRFNRARVRVRPQDRLLEYRGRAIPLSSYGVDSEVFFKILIHELRDYGGEEPLNVLHVLDHIMNSDIILDFHSLNFVMGSHRYLYALRYYNEDCEECAEKYTLYYMIRRGNSPAGKLLKKRMDEVALFVCSEPITGPRWIEEVRKIRKEFPEEEWRPIDNMTLLMVPIGRPQDYRIERLG